MDKWLKVAELIDAYRVVPRIFMVCYMVAAGYIILWYTGIPDPSTEQTTFAGVIGGTIGAVTKWYYDTGRKWDQ